MSTAVTIEEWRDVPGYEGRYQVSNIGRVKSLPRTRRTKGGGVCPVHEKMMKLTVNTTTGYLVVDLYSGNGIRGARQFGAHQLVLMAFVGPCPQGMEACHFPDTTRTNNNLENLRWDTHANNNRDRVYAKGEEHHEAKLTVDQVLEIRWLHESGESVNEIVREFNVSSGTISSVVRNKSWKWVESE